MEFEVQVKFLVLLVLVGLIQQSFELPLSAFYPYGPSAGDTAAPINDDASTGRIPISISFPFYGKAHGSLFVSV